MSEPRQFVLPIAQVDRSRIPCERADRTYTGAGEDARLAVLSCPRCELVWRVSGPTRGVGLVAASADAHVRACTGWNVSHGIAQRKRPPRYFRPAKNRSSERLF